MHRKRALVIGGSGGIGREAAFELASCGIDVIVHGGHSQERLDRTIDALRADGGVAQGLLLAVQKPSDFLAKLPELGRIDILVVAFGPFGQSSLASTTCEDWEKFALLDLALPGALVSYYLPAMKRQGWGRILLFGGTKTDLFRSCHSNAAYAAAKAGLGIVVKSAAAEGAPEVGSILVCPGFVDTEYLDDADRGRLAAKAPGKVLIEPRHLAHQALSLLLAEPCTASGAIISMDGGLVL